MTRALRPEEGDHVAVGMVGSREGGPPPVVQWGSLFAIQRGWYCTRPPHSMVLRTPGPRPGQAQCGVRAGSGEPPHRQKGLEVQSYSPAGSWGRVVSLCLG